MPNKQCQLCLNKYKNLSDEKFKHGKNNDIKSILKRILSSSSLSSCLLDGNNETVLHLAARYNWTDHIKTLIEAGCDVNVKNSFGQTPLFLALYSNSLEVFEALMDTNDNIWTNISEAKTILQLLVSRKDTLPAAIAIKFMKKLKSCSKDLKTIAALLLKVNCPVIFVIYMSDARLTQMLIEMVNYEMNKNECMAALKYVIEIADLKNLRVLWQSERMIQSRDSYLETIITLSTKLSTNWRYMSPLFKNLTDWVVLDKVSILFLKSVFTLADKYQLITLLKHYNVDVQIKQKFDLDLLPILFFNYHLNIEDLKELLYKRQFNVNARSIGGMTALHFAALHDGLDVIRFLLELNPNCNIKDNSGLTPLHYAINSEFIELLLLNGADIHSSEIDPNRSLVIKMRLCRDTAEVVIAQLAIDQYQGKQINDTLLDAINRSLPFKYFLRNCLIQVNDSMKCEILPSLTVFAILTKKAKSLSLYIENIETFSIIMNHHLVQSLHSYYYALLKRNLEEADYLYQTKCLITTIFCKNVPTPINIYNIVIDRICDFLSHKDMLVFLSV